LPLFKETGELPKNLDFLCKQMQAKYETNGANDEWFNLSDVRVAA
jgi:hypothetical protein